jgi:hypothetical protein
LALAGLRRAAATPRRRPRFALASASRPIILRSMAASWAAIQRFVPVLRHERPLALLAPAAFDLMAKSCDYSPAVAMLDGYPAIAGAAAKLRARSFTLDGEAVVCGTVDRHAAFGRGIGAPGKDVKK